MAQDSNSRCDEITAQEHTPARACVARRAAARASLPKLLSTLNIAPDLTVDLAHTHTTIISHQGSPCGNDDQAHQRLTAMREWASLQQPPARTTRQCRHGGTAFARTTAGRQKPQRR
jgi:hypothetical protein